MSDTRASVLIVDDQPDNLRSLASILRIEGYKVRKAVSGEVALETVRSQPPDLILLDIRMPLMDGYAVCSTLKATTATREIPIIFLSALDDTAQKVKAFAVGGTDYITKPFQAEEVVARVENQLRLQRLSKQLKEQSILLQNEIRTRQQTEMILEQEIGDRKTVEAQLQHQAQILANFTFNLKLLHRLSTRSYSHLEQLFAAYLQTGFEILGFPTGIISQVKSETYTIRAVKSNLEFLKPNLELNLDATYCAAVVQTKQTITYPDVGKVAQRQKHPVDQNLKIRSYIGTPIIVNGVIYGTLNFFSTQVRTQDFAVEEKELIELMAQSLSREIATYQAEMQREQAQEALRLSALRIRHQNQILLELARNPAINQGDVPAALQVITQATAQDSAVERVSVWLFDSTGTYLQCCDLFEKKLNQHSPGTQLVVADYPTYCHALLHEQLIVADNAHTAPETQELVDSYLAPLGILSRLDAPIRLGGQTVGVLSSEQVGAARPWTPEDENFARSAADLVSFALEARERRQMQEKLHQAHADLEERATELVSANEELEVMLEELRITQEELLEKHEELVSSRQLAERERQRYHDLFEFAPDGYVVTDTWGKIQEANRATAALLCIDQSLLIDQALSHFIPRQEHQTFRTQLHQLANQQLSVRHWELNLQTQQGYPFPAAITIAAMHDVQGKLVSLRWLIRDITERKQTEDEMHSARAFLDSIIENIPHMIFLKDADQLRFVRFNKAGEELLGYSRQELMGKNDYDFFPNEQADFFIAKDRQVLASQDVFDIPEEPLQTRNKEIRILHTKKIRILDAAGKPQYLLGISEDITERKQREAALRQSSQRERQKAQELKSTLEELKRTQAQLIQTEKMSSLGRMVAGVAHEFNNPISFIYGNLIHARQYFQDLVGLLEIYQQTYPNPTPKIQELASQIDVEFLLRDWSELMDSMQVGAERIYEMVRLLLLFSRLNQSERKCCDIHEGIDNTLLLLQYRLRAQGDHPAIKVIKDYGRPPSVTCYVSQLNQVFMNLLSNAIDALEAQPEPRVITIRTSLKTEEWEQQSEQFGTNSDVQLPPKTNRQWLVIQIADNGPGMSKDVLHQIFDPFFTTKPVGSGTGLGLAISQQIVVEKHGGKLSCISVLGQGTEFIVEIPLQPK
jgi:PAS domain S-box-containing protein